jgi:surface antigen
MKTKLLWVLPMAGLLTACATTSVPGTADDSVQQNLSAADRVQLKKFMNTTHDGEPAVWHNSEGNTAFELTTADTHVNAQGLPCRNYTLVIDRDYHSKITVTGLSCRDDGEWKDQT